MLTAERLRAVLKYDPLSGHFTWRQSPSNRVKVGSRAGSKKGNGYVYIGIDGREYLAHRLAWLYFIGTWPTHEIDHRDTDSSNNRWSNLRAATPTVNKQNRRRACRNSRTGLLGASWDQRAGKFASSIVVSGKKHSLGYYATAQAAHAAYVAAKRQLHEGNTL